MELNWQPIETAPKDGTVFWGWLYDSGIMLMRWLNVEEAAGPPELYVSCFVICGQEYDGDYQPKFWLPLDAIKIPDGVYWTGSRWRDKQTTKVLHTTPSER